LVKVRAGEATWCAGGRWNDGKAGILIATEEVKVGLKRGQRLERKADSEQLRTFDYAGHGRNVARANDGPGGWGVLQVL
jgi:hypothetical protein